MTINTHTRYVNDITVTTYIEAISCGTEGCGLVFGLSAEFIEARRKDHRTFYCPNGHPRHWPAPTISDAKRLEWADARERALRDQLDSTERSRRAYKGKVTQIKRRVGNGVCPCCNRTFADLQRHMAGQHPDFTETKA